MSFNDRLVILQLSCKKSRKEVIDPFTEIKKILTRLQDPTPNYKDLLTSLLVDFVIVLGRLCNPNPK